MNPQTPQRRPSCWTPGAQPSPSAGSPSLTQLAQLSATLLATLSHLSHTYSQVGYDSSVVKRHQSNIFKEIHHMLQTHLDHSEREKATLEGECQWLREQSKTLLTLCDDPQGLQLLIPSERLLVFEGDPTLSEIPEAPLLPQVPQFAPVPRCEPPPATLLELKVQLNKSYFKILLEFNELYLRLSHLNITAHTLLRQLGAPSPPVTSDLMAQMPSLEESQTFLQLYERFKRSYLALFESPGKAPDRLEESVIYSRVNSLSTSPRRTLILEGEPGATEGSANETTPGRGPCPPPKSPHPSLNPRDSSPTTLQKANFELIKLIKSGKTIRLSETNMALLTKEIATLQTHADRQALVLVETLDTLSETISVMGLTAEDLEALGVVLPLPEIRAAPQNHLALLAQLQLHVQTVNRAKDRIEHQKGQLYDQIRPLWDRLKQSDAFTRTIEDRAAGYNDAAVAVLQTELVRLAAVRRERLAELIGDVQVQIEATWRLLNYSPQQCPAEYTGDVEASEETLARFEAYLAALAEEHRKVQPLLTLIGQFESLVNEKLLLDESSKDSSRLLLKGSSTVLLAEERTRKKVARQLPRMFEVLKAKLAAYRLEEGRDFLHQGARYFETVCELERVNFPRKETRNSRNNPRNTPRNVTPKDLPEKTAPSLWSTPTPALVAPHPLLFASTSRSVMRPLSPVPLKLGPVTRSPSPAFARSVRNPSPAFARTLRGVSLTRPPPPPPALLGRTRTMSPGHSLSWANGWSNGASRSLSPARSVSRGRSPSRRTETVTLSFKSRLPLLAKPATSPVRPSTLHKPSLSPLRLPTLTKPSTSPERPPWGVPQNSQRPLGRISLNLSPVRGIGQKTKGRSLGNDRARSRPRFEKENIEISRVGLVPERPPTPNESVLSSDVGEADYELWREEKLRLVCVEDEVALISHLPEA